ncbi:tryptophan RNA-binding attenuator protein-like protein [Anaeramoeba ignava]|uniref:Tryptophan RNA-binding attenuator protein-like protein n=1 Tax=Anaeramoeba ignava TaxID=1746090 RepID=A0A9Q0REQ6_ANAIG|nr:tryptophan RNA-binding attenuator protein-like protein [Anaeramoeba ignava]
MISPKLFPLKSSCLNLQTLYRSINYKVLGVENQVIEVTLEPGEKIQANPTSIMYQDQGIEVSTKAKGGFRKSISRMFIGESFLLMNAKNTTNETKKLILTKKYPGEIFPLELDEKSWVIDRGTFLGSTTDIDFQSKWLGFKIGLFTRKTLSIEKLIKTDPQKKNSIAFCSCGGSSIKRQLKPDEKILVSSSHLVAFNESVKIQAKWIKGFWNKLVGYRSLFEISLTGPGDVILQTNPFNDFMNLIQSKIVTYSNNYYDFDKRDDDDY